MHIIRPIQHNHKNIEHDIWKIKSNSICSFYYHNFRNQTRIKFNYTMWPLEGCVFWSQIDLFVSLLLNRIFWPRWLFESVSNNIVRVGSFKIQSGCFFKHEHFKVCYTVSIIDSISKIIFQFIQNKLIHKFLSRTISTELINNSCATILLTELYNGDIRM